MQIMLSIKKVVAPMKMQCVVLTIKRVVLLVLPALIQVRTVLHVKVHLS